jgi:hypothetical protein
MHFFSILALHLAKFGTPFHEVRRTLESGARIAPHSQKRRAQVPSIMASLKWMGLVG